MISWQDSKFLQKEATDIKRGSVVQLDLISCIR